MIEMSEILVRYTLDPQLTETLALVAVTAPGVTEIVRFCV
jgi:hypothetical protein